MNQVVDDVGTFNGRGVLTTDFGVEPGTLPGYYGLVEGAWKHWARVWDVPYDWVLGRFKDKKLMEAEEGSLQLKPEEWKSGDILWLVHAAGETRFVRQVVDELTKTTLKGRQVKVRAHDPAGKSKIHVLGASAQG